MVVCTHLCALPSISTFPYFHLPQRDRFRQFSNKGEIIYDADNERVVYMVEYTSRGETGAFYDLKLYKEVCVCACKAVMLDKAHMLALAMQSQWILVMLDGTGIMCEI